MRQFGQYLTPSGSYEVSQSRDTGIKLTLIKRLYKLGILITIALALIPLKVGSFVTEPQGPTYSPEEVRLETATSTQPDLDRSLATSKDVVLISTTTITTGSTVRTNQVPRGLPTVKKEDEYVVKKILETFPEAPIMVYVAMCESGLDPNADRVTHDGRTGIDVGLFQINQVHSTRLNELGLDRYDLQDNLTYARMLYDSAGLRDWHMSKHCWSRYL